MMASPNDFRYSRLGDGTDGMLVWLFFGCGFAVSLASALMYSLLHLPLQPGMRELLVGGCLVAAAVFAVAGWLVRQAPLKRGALISGWAAVALICLVSVGLGEGVHAVVLGFFSVVVCSVTVLTSLRAGVLMAAFCALVVGLLALAEQRQWIYVATSTAGPSWVLHAVSQWLLIVSSISIGVLMQRVVTSHLLLAHERQQRFRTLLRLAASWYWEVDHQFRFTAISQERDGGSDFSAAPFLGRTPWEVPGMGIDAPTMACLRRDFEAHAAFSGVAVRRRDAATGTVLHLRMSGEPRFDAAGGFAGFWGVGRDVTTEVEATRAISASESRYRELFNSCPTPLVLHRAGRVIDANKATLDLLGYPDHQSIIGVDLTLHYDAGEARDTVRALVALGEQMPPGWSSTPRQVALTSTHGQRLQVQARAVRVPADGGPAMLVLFDDETERLAAGQALKAAHDQAQAANQAKSAFLANTSHEIRTPLNGLIGLSQLALRDDVDGPQRMRYVEQIRDTAQSLSDIITDILDLSKIEAGTLTIERVPFDLHQMLDSIRRTYAPLAAARDLGFELQVDTAVPGWIVGDPVRIRQILGNFVNNAFKFTARGQVHVDIRLAGPSRLRMQVADTGPGLDDATCARLFKPFTQADVSMTRRFGGTGLGLSICRELANLMGGQVGVDSALGKGSSFWAELPMQAVEPSQVDMLRAAVPAAGSAGMGALLRGRRVLVVEDNPVNRLIVVALLKHEGVQVHEAVDGRAAVDAVDAAVGQGLPFDAVLMDVQMPVMSGYEATRELRTRYDAQVLPIVALTAAALVSERDAAFACGMDEFVTKPIDIQALWAALTRVLARRRPPG